MCAAIHPIGAQLILSVNMEEEEGRCWYSEVEHFHLRQVVYVHVYVVCLFISRIT